MQVFIAPAATLDWPRTAGETQALKQVGTS